MGKTETVTFQAEITAHFDIPAGIWQDYVHFFIWCLTLGDSSVFTLPSGFLKKSFMTLFLLSRVVYNKLELHYLLHFFTGVHRQNHQFTPFVFVTLFNLGFH